MVGLVDDGQLDRIERAGAALDQVDEPAGASRPRRRPRDGVPASASGWVARRLPLGRIRPEAGPSGASASVTCMASSRVGTSTRRARATGAGRPCSSRAISGRPNASVLPAPVAARPSRSRPASTSGMIAAWIGNGSVMPAGRARRSARWAGPARRSSADLGWEPPGRGVRPTPFGSLDPFGSAEPGGVGDPGGVGGPGGGGGPDGAARRRGLALRRADKGGTQGSFTRAGRWRVPAIRSA